MSSCKTLTCGKCEVCLFHADLDKNKHNNFVVEQPKDGSTAGYGDRELVVVLRSQIQDFLRSAPSVPGKGKRQPNRPKLYEDDEKSWPSRPETAKKFLEYPAVPYPYHNQRNGLAYDDYGEKVSPGYVRIITHKEKEIAGVAVHPKHKWSSLLRATEITPFGEQLVYPLGCNGIPIIFPAGWPLQPPGGKDVLPWSGLLAPKPPACASEACLTKVVKLDRYRNMPSPSSSSRPPLLSQSERAVIQAKRLNDPSRSTALSEEWSQEGMGPSKLALQYEELNSSGADDKA